MSLSTFIRLANSIRVGDIVRPFDDKIPTAMTIGDTWAKLSELNEWGSGAWCMILVTHGGRAFGWLDHESKDTLCRYIDSQAIAMEPELSDIPEEEEEGCVPWWNQTFVDWNPPLRELLDVPLGDTDSIIVDLPAGSLVAADYPLRSILERLAGDPEEIVIALDGDEATGFMTYENLDCLEFRACLTILLFQVEEVALKVASRAGALESWSCLAKARQEKAKRLLRTLPQEAAKAGYSDVDEYIANNGASADATSHPLCWGLANSPAHRLLELTDFSDKGTILAERRLIKGFESDRIAALFDSARLIRNRCAHTGESFLPEPHEFSDLIRGLHRLLDSCRKFLEHPNQ